VAGKAELFRPHQLHTVEGGLIPAAFASMEPGGWMAGPDLPGPSLNLAQIFNARRGFSHLRAGLDELEALNTQGDMFVLHAQDCEDFWRGPYLNATRRQATTEMGTGIASEEMVARFEEALSVLEDTPYIEFNTVSEFMARHKPQGDYYIRPSVGFFDRDSFGIWDRGMWNQASGLNHNCDRAIEEIHHAEMLLGVAKKLGTDNPRSEALVREAWDSYGMSRTSSGRGYHTTEPFGLWCNDFAVKAYKLAHEAVEAIEYR
jgi:hypothetical protein